MVAVFYFKMRRVLSLQMAAFYIGRVYEQQSKWSVQAHQEAAFALNIHCLFLNCMFLWGGLREGV